MAETPKHEKRSHFRGKARPGRRVNVFYRLADAPGDELVAAVTRNIGVGGAFVLTAKPHPPDTKLILRIEIPGTEELLEVAGEVRWSEKSGDEDDGMGINFIDVDVDGVLRLSEYFASLTGADS